MKSLHLFAIIALTSCAASTPQKAAQENIKPNSPMPSIDESFNNLHNNQTVANDLIGSLSQNNSSVIEHCGEGMTFISGGFCAKPQQICLEWLDNPSHSWARCKKYQAPTKCLSDKVAMNYCIGTEEVHTSDGMPIQNQSWNQCKAICESTSQRLCSNEEWTLACEGEEMLPYPYGYEFQKDKCNIETQPLLTLHGEVFNHNENISEHQHCVSPFGVHNLIGNEDEWIIVPLYSHSQVAHIKMRSALKGGHWAGGRHRCRPGTFDHNESFHQISTGCRCCADAN